MAGALSGWLGKSDAVGAGIRTPWRPENPWGSSERSAPFAWGARIPDPHGPCSWRAKVARKEQLVGQRVDMLVAFVDAEDEDSRAAKRRCHAWQKARVPSRPPKTTAGLAAPEQDPRIGIGTVDDCLPFCWKPRAGALETLPEGYGNTPFRVQA